MVAPSILNARLSIVFAVMFMSMSGIGIKLCSLGPWQIGGFRSLFAALTLVLLVREARHPWSWRILLVGVAFAGMLVTFVWGNKTTTAANTIFLQSSAPLWVLLLSPVLLKEGIRLREVGAMLIFGVGLALVCLHPERATALSPEIQKGNWLALASGVCYALVIMGLRALRGRGDVAAVVCGNCLAFLICLPPQNRAAWGGAPGMLTGTLQDWLIVAWLGSVQVALPYVLFTRGLRILPAVQVSLIGLIEAVLNPLWVFLVYHEERPGSGVLLGGAIILAAAAYQIVAKERK